MHPIGLQPEFCGMKMSLYAATSLVNKQMRIIYGRVNDVVHPPRWSFSLNSPLSRMEVWRMLSTSTLNRYSHHGSFWDNAFAYLVFARCCCRQTSHLANRNGADRCFKLVGHIVYEIIFITDNFSGGCVVHHDIIIKRNNKNDNYNYRGNEEGTHMSF